MHAEHGHAPEEYFRYLGWKNAIIILCCLGLGAVLIFSLGLGSARIPAVDVLASLFGAAPDQRTNAIVCGIRLPQALSAMVAGGGLAIAGAVMQAVLRNPLGSPFTLGIAHAAAFGAACSVMLGSGLTGSGRNAVTIINPYTTTAAALAASLAASAVIVAISRLRGTRPETMILAGVALGALCTAATMFLQFFASDVQLAAMVFWTFGDTARASWNELGIMAAVTLFCFLFFWANSWNYNAIDAGDETARGLGVRVERVRMGGMLLASLVTAVLIACLGIIGFVGLVIPHMFRRLIGADHRFLLPASLVGGALLLLLADTAARLVLMPHLVPVSVLTAFLGAPAFLWLIIRGQRP
ncbi:MAG: iron ABC transporter permease [Desulfobulbaceae bacterium]|nr:iron ABC transporter permease [Desulfobulbaceae bacterium]